MYVFDERRGRVEVAFTDRHGPDGMPLSLALPGTAAAAVPGTDPQASLALVQERFARGDRVQDMHQVHGAEVALVDRAGPPDRPYADGLVTTDERLTLLVRVADCVPVLLADLERGVLGAAHAGRQGVFHAVVPAVVATMRAHGAAAIHAWIGPHVCGRCYEVPAQMREEVAGRVPQTAAETSWGTPALDLGAGVRAQLEALDVTLTAVGGCTVEDEDLWSHRRQGAAAGRLAGLIRVAA